MIDMNIGVMGNRMGVYGLKISYSFPYKGKFYADKEMFKFGTINSSFKSEINKMKVGDLCKVYFSSKNPDLNTIYSNCPVNNISVSFIVLKSLRQHEKMIKHQWYDLKLKFHL
jgi:hypothetical protein